MLGSNPLTSAAMFNGDFAGVFSCSRTSSVFFGPEGVPSSGFDGVEGELGLAGVFEYNRPVGSFTICPKNLTTSACSGVAYFSKLGITS